MEFLHPDNVSYQSVAQSVGQKLGSILATTVFVTFNSSEFCNKWVYSEPQEQPLATISGFLWWWAVLQMGITVYILIFVAE